MSLRPTSDEPLAPRLRRETRTISRMIHMYCSAHHPLPPPDQRGATGLCLECAALLDYAQDHVLACRFGADKPTCDRCAVQCFGPAQREQIKAVMRYAGPRMVTKHPYLALRHLLDGRRARD